MSKLELRELGPTINITRSIKRELKKNLDQLKEVLKDNPEFAQLLVEKSLLIAKGVFTNEIKRLIFKEYVDLSDELSHNELRHKLLQITYDLGNLIYGDHELTQREILRYSQDERDEYSNILRDEIEQEVRNIFFLEENIKVDIIGEI